MKQRYTDQYFYDTHLTVEWHDPEEQFVRLTQKKDPTCNWQDSPSINIVLGAEDVRCLALTLNRMADIMAAADKAEELEAAE